MYTPTFPHQHAANPESHTHILAVNPVFQLFSGCTNGPSGLACGLFLFLGYLLLREGGYAAMGGAFASAGSVSVWRRARSSSSLVAAYTASTLRELRRASLVSRRRLEWTIARVCRRESAGRP